jgi:hypothetical protein
LAHVHAARQPWWHGQLIVAGRLALEVPLQEIGRSLIF